MLSFHALLDGINVREAVTPVSSPLGVTAQVSEQLGGLTADLQGRSNVHGPPVCMMAGGNEFHFGRPWENWGH